MIRPRHRRSNAGQRGSALLEFAGSLLVISALFSGMFQFGYAVYSYGRLFEAVREGARYASLLSDGSSSTNADFSRMVQRMVVYGDPTPPPGRRPVVSGLAEKNVELVATDKTMTVTIRNFQLEGLFSKINLDGRPTVTFPCTNGARR